MFNLWRINKKVIEPSGPKIAGALTSENIKKILRDSNDITVKEVFTWNEKIKIVAIGIDGLVDSDVIDNFVLRPLTVGRPFENVSNEKEAYNLAKEVCKRVDSIDELAYSLFNKMIELIPSDIDIKELQDAWDKVSKEYKNITNE